jgi:hypothetical protein
MGLVPLKINPDLFDFKTTEEVRPGSDNQPSEVATD